MLYQSTHMIEIILRMLILRMHLTINTESIVIYIYISFSFRFSFVRMSEIREYTVISLSDPKENINSHLSFDINR
jgi:hypothetical protein